MHDSRGIVSPLVLTVVGLAVAAVGLGAFGAWAYVNYLDQKNNVDAKVQLAVAEARKDQTAKDESAFAEREKSPVRQFVGPQDFGQVTFDYPKTWSVYIGENGSRGGNYEAYLNPGAVAAVGEKNFYALRITVSSKSYEDELKTFQGEITKGDLKASAATVGGQAGTRLDGAFSNTAKGAMVLLKLRDKTLQVYTETQDYLGDFDKTILPSLKYNP